MRGIRTGVGTTRQRCSASTPVGEVVRQAADGDGEAWQELHRRYGRMVATVARTSGCATADVADVEQLVWTRLWRHIQRLRQPEAVGGWLAVVAKRESRRLAQRHARTIPVDAVDPGAVDPGATTDDEPLATLLRTERRAAVRRSVATLPPRWRRLLETMLDHPDMAYAQVAARLGMPVGSIGPTRQRCIDDLRQQPALLEWHPALVPAAR